MLFRFSLAALLACALVPLQASTPSRPSAQLPVLTQNVGQAIHTDGTPVPNVDALIDSKNGMAYVSASRMSIVQERLIEWPENGDPLMDLYRVDVELIGANAAARLEILSEEAGWVRFIGPADGPQGHIAQRWSKIIYRDIYDGIDKVITMTSDGPKVDFIVHPGADPSQIAMRFIGATPTLLTDGSLRATTPLGTISDLAPIAFLAGAGGSKVDARYIVSGSTVRFQLGQFDRSKELVIDPTRMWATYYGGNGSTNDVRTAMGKCGDVYLMGTTATRNLPVTPGVLQTRYRARSDAFAAKFTHLGRLVWHTYCGGTGSDNVMDAALDKYDYVWMCGRLDSNNNPLVNFDRSGSGPFGSLDGDTIIMQAGYMLRLDSNGAWGDSWILDGRDDDAIAGFDIRNDRIAIVGYTRSPRVNDVQGNPYSHNSNNNYRQFDMFVARLSLRLPSTNRWQGDWLTYYGGGDDDWGTQVTINNAGVVTAIGYSASNDIPTTNGSAYRGNWDAFVLNITSPTAATPTRGWALYLASDGNDIGYDAASDPQGNPVFVGYTGGTNFPTAAAYRNTSAGSADGFITKFNVANGNLIYSTYFGGTEVDIIRGVSISPAGNVWVGGRTASPNLPVTNDAFQKTIFTDPNYILSDGFFTQFNPTVTTVLYGTYYGAPPQANLPPPPAMGDPPLPPNTDFGDDELMAVYADGDAYIALATRVASLNMPTTTGAYQDKSVLNQDTIKSIAFLTVFSNCPDTAITITVDGPPTLCRNESRRLLAPNGFAKYKWSNGDTVRIINVSDTGSYHVIATDSKGCRFRDTVRITRSPSPDVSAGNDTSACLNVLVRLTATPVGGTPPYSYKWKRIEAGPSFIDDDTLQSPGVNPNSTSRYEVTVTDSNGCQDKDTVRVSVINPLPTFAPATVDFGLLDACETSREDTVTISNPMTYAVTITGSVPDDPRIEVSSSLTPGIIIPAGGSAKVILKVSPSAPGVTNGTIKITGVPCNWSLDVKYRVEKARLLATILPGTLDFGAAASCNATARDSVTVIRNGGTDPLILQQGIVGAPFTILAPSGQVTVAPGDTIHVRIRFNPVADGAFSDIVRFPFASGTCNDTLRVTVRGSRQSVSVDAQPTTFDMGTLLGCEDERDTTFVIRNTGSVTATITLPTLTDVVFTPPGPLTITAGDSVTVTVTIRPASSGPFSATPRLTVQPCDGEILLAISATKQGVAFTTPSSIAFGELNTCTDGQASSRIESITFTGSDSSVVETVTLGSTLTTDLVPGTVIRTGVPRSFSVTWTPTVDGALVDSMVIVFQPCDVRRVIRITGMRTTPALRAQTLIVALGAINTDATGTVVFENSGTDTLFLGAAASANAVVVATRPAASTPILPGGTMEVDYRILCRSVINDTIRVTTQGSCVLSATTVFTGTCDQIVPNVSATIAIDSVGVMVGDRFELPMRLIQSTGLAQAGLTTWTADITYNPMVIVGSGNTPDCFKSGQYTPCTITVGGTRSDTLGVLALLDFTAVLGTDAQTDVVISNFKWTQDTTVVSTTQNGRVLLKDICYEGGPRYLTPKSEAFSIRVYPIPASSTLTIDIKGMGTTPGTWSLANYVGQTVDSGPLQPDTEGSVVVQVDVRTIASGTYFLTIDARGTIERMPVLIQR
jgi:hypothetical protein